MEARSAVSGVASSEVSVFPFASTDGARPIERPDGVAHAIDVPMLV